MIVHTIHLPTPQPTDNISPSERGSSGFGSTEEKESVEKEPSQPSKPTEVTTTEDEIEILNQQPIQAITPALPATTHAPIPAEPNIIPIEDGDIEDNSGNGPVPLEDLLKATGVQLPSEGPHIIPPDHRVQATMSEMLLPYSIHISTDIYDNLLTREMPIAGTHPTRGLKILQCPHRDLPTIHECMAGTDAGKLKKWRSTMRGAYILAINDVEMTNEADIVSFFKTTTDSQVTLRLGTIEKQAMHPDDGVPMMYFDQLNMIAQHLRELKYGDDDNTETQQAKSATPPTDDSKIQATMRMIKAMFFDGILPHSAAIKAAQELKPKNKQRSKKLTRRILIKQDDWEDWKQSEWKQLDQYEAQDTFREPCILPSGSNCLSLLWTYLIKDVSGIKKARCVCNGRPNNPGTVTWGHTYAKALDQV